MKLLITGSKGQLGSEIRELSVHYPDYDFFFTSREELDICDKGSVVSFVRSNKIDTIINCAAYTAVDKAESEPALADKINHLAVKNLAKIAKEGNIRLVHISTDYVFDGKGFKPYPIDHPTDPVNTYGKSKLKGEQAVQEINPENSMIIRTSWVYSSYGNNFVKTILRLGEEREQLNVISDQVGAPTYAKDLAAFILTEAVKRKNNQVEIFHFSNEGVCSWYDFAKEIFNLGKIDCEVLPTKSSEYKTPAVRPYYGLMDKCNLIKEFNIKIPYWKSSLKNCIENIFETENLK